MKKLYRWIIGIAVSPFVLSLLLTLLLYCPPVQRWAVGIATQYASEETGMDISIDDVRLRFPLDLQLNGVKAIQPNDSLPQLKDTLINAQSIICEVQLRPLFDSNVQIDIMQMDGVQLNTSSYISDCRIKGTIEQLMLTSHGIDLKRDTLMLDKAFMSKADLDICLSDTAKEDTIEKPQPDWIVRFQKLDIKDSHVLVHMSGDTLNISADIGLLNARNGTVNLLDGLYEVASADLNNSSLEYDNRFETKVKGLDFNHISLKDLNIGIDSLYYKATDLSLRLRACNFREKCGIALTSLTGDITLDSTTVFVKALNLETGYGGRNPYTSIRGDVNLDFNTFAKQNPGTMAANINARIGKHDMMLIAGSSLPEQLVRRWPETPATITGRLSGNMKMCQLSDVVFDVPTLAKGNIAGCIQNIDNPDNIAGNASLNVTAYSGNGTIKGTASFAARAMKYNADLSINSLNINHFMPGSGLGRFSGDVNVQGYGADLFARKTAINADARIRQFRYGHYNLAGATLKASLKNGIAHADIKTVANIMRTNISLNGRMDKRILDATVKADIDNIDLYALNMVKKPLSLSVNGGFSLKTDFKDNYSLRGRVGNICITDTMRQFTPNDIEVNLLTRRDTTYAHVACGDFLLNSNFNTGYKRLLGLSESISKEIDRQLQTRIIDEMALRNKFPTGTIRVSSGGDNPMARFANTLGYRFAYLDADVSLSKAGGINGYVAVDTLKVNDMQFDDVDLTLNSDARNMYYKLRIVNGKENPDFCFAADVSGQMMPNGTMMALKLDDQNGKRGVDVNLKALMEMDNIRICIDDDHAILGYQNFRVNTDNYIRLGNDMRVAADMRLRSDNGMGIQIYTDDDNMDAIQDITLSVNKLNLGNLTASLPFMPNITGSMNGDFHFIKEPSNMSISCDADFEKLFYEGSPLGNVSTELVYMPLEDGSHQIDGVLLRENDEIANIKGRYFFEGADMIDAEMELIELPLDYINGFIPDQIVGLKGNATGTLSVKDYVSQPVINGTVNLSDAKLVSVPYGIELSMDSKTLDVVDSRIRFSDYHLISSNGNPFVVNGRLDFSDLSNINTDMNITGKNVQIVDAKENRRSEAYGKAFVDLKGRITGPLSKLNMKAQLDVLPSTNLYYILRDSPITTDNRLKELVTFADLSDEQHPQVTLPSIDGLTMDVNINIRNGSHIVCWLNEKHTNYLDIYGNGELRFLYAQEQMKMTGRYTFTEGEMKYSLPVIPLKTFSISEDSYIEFSGDIMNPHLNITATEHNRATTSVDGEDTNVDFVCGVVLSKTLQDMGLEFVISAPENQTVNDHLNMLSIEERGKLAVGMLTTGMYLDDTNNGNITMNTALSSFLQQEINNIAGSALKTLDLSIGFENSTTPDGTLHLDYSFKFAKRFWNNRISVAIGGKISTGSQSAGKTPSFFDNVEVEYRLSDTSNQYLQLFYKHDVYDYLEGYLDHFGAGYMWKRKFQNFNDIFNIRKDKGLKIIEEKDTTNAKDSL